MERKDLAKFNLPDAPGIYRFLDVKGKILYVGKATSLSDRVRSYFANDLLHTRGKHMLDMVTKAALVTYTQTDSVLEALILEASEIKKREPYYNSKEKDNKSWNYVVITREEYPRVLTLRERDMFSGIGDVDGQYKYTFGPFPQGSHLGEALKIIRRIFPYRDNNCLPAQTCQKSMFIGAKTRNGNNARVLTARQRVSAGKPCFNRQIGLCPGVCTGEISQKAYAERIRQIKLLFEGKKSLLLKRLTRLMHDHAKKLEFEAAGEYKRMIFALRHIQDISLIKEDVREASREVASTRRRAFRIEAYDVAHISGKYTVGVMTVVEDGRTKKSGYRKFRIRILKDHSDDTLHLEEVLRRRFAHPDWGKPDLLVVDGGVAQKRRAERVIKALGVEVEIVSVVKDKRHKPQAILGNKEIADSFKRGILIANMEAHRFAVAYHRKLREKLPKATKNFQFSMF